MIKSVVIIGTGALATFYGTKWISMYRVSVLGTWEVSINALNKIDGIEAFLNWHSANEPDLVVWLTKTYKNEEALEKYSKLRWSCPILILQNGIGQKEHFRKTLGEQQKLFSGITTQGAKLIDPGKYTNPSYFNCLLWYVSGSNISKLLESLSLLLRLNLIKL